MPMFWDRYNFDLVSTPGSVAAFGSEILDPTFYDANDFDNRYTVKRIRLEMAYVYTTTLADATASPVAVFGVYWGGQNAPLRSPLMATGEDVTTDWMDLWKVQWAVPESIVGSARRTPVLLDSIVSRDIRVARRMQTNQVLILTGVAFFLGGPTEPNHSVRVQVTGSNLVAKTRPGR